jgi:hypothetical protein
MASMPVPQDTTPDADEVQIEAYRRMGRTGRAAATFSLIELARRLALAGIRARHPDYGDEQLRMAYARLVLGDALVRRAWPHLDLVEP